MPADGTEGTRVPDIPRDALQEGMKRTILPRLSLHVPPGLYWQYWSCLAASWGAGTR